MQFEIDVIGKDSKKKPEMKSIGVKQMMGGGADAGGMP